MNSLLFNLREMLKKLLVCWGKHMYCYNLLVTLLFIFTLYTCFLRNLAVDWPELQRSKIKVPKVGDANKLSHKHLFQKLLRKNASEFSEEETAFFLTYKESQYDARRERVETYCHTKTKDREFGKKIIKNSLIYDERDGVSYCQIAKVASSSWCNHFIKLANVSDREYKRWRDALQLLAPDLWPPPKDLLQAWHREDNLSLVIVRHPMSRLASVYYQKFVELRNHKGWSKVIKRIISRYRKEGDYGPMDHPTPSEFLRYVLDNLKNAGASNVDQHWRPQSAACPFCLLQFSIYARMEELNEDSLYFFIKSGLISRHNVNPDKKMNSAHAEHSTETRFWEQVEPSVVELLQSQWAYKDDMEMFGYNVTTYLSDIGVILK